MNQRHRLRLPDFDYSSPGIYLITMCTHDRMCLFGEVKNGQMVLNEIGDIVQKKWLWLKEQYSYVELDEHQVMPNHIHGLLEIKPGVQGQHIKPLDQLIGAFKTVSSKEINQQNGVPQQIWQRSYHERIIVGDQALYAAREYIRNNPANWDKDPNNT